MIVIKAYNNTKKESNYNWNYLSSTVSIDKNENDNKNQYTNRPYNYQPQLHQKKTSSNTEKYQKTYKYEQTTYRDKNKTYDKRNIYKNIYL